MSFIFVGIFVIVRLIYNIDKQLRIIMNSFKPYMISEQIIIKSDFIAYWHKTELLKEIKGL